MSGSGRGTIARRAAAWIGVGALALTAVAASAESAESQARAIFDALHVERELADIAAQAAASVAEPARSLPPADALVLRAAVASCFESGRLGALALDVFSKRLDRAHAPAALGWLERPETQDLLRRIAAGSETNDATSVAAEPTGDAAARDALLLRFERRGGHAGRAQRHAALVFGAMLHAANPLLPPLHRYSPAELEALTRALRERVGALPSDPAELRRRYAGVPSEALSAALAFLESPAGEWLRRELDLALERALVAAANATAAHLVGSLGSRAPHVPLLVARLQGP